MFKKIALILLALILIALAIVFALKRRNLNGSGISAYQFVGGVQSIEEKDGKYTITADGAFSSDNNPDVSKQKVTVTVQYNGKTKFTRTVVQLPSPEELIETQGYFDGSKLKRDTADADVRAMHQDFQDQNLIHMNIIAKSDKNIYGQDKFTANEISYEIAKR